MNDQDFTNANNNPVTDDQIIRGIIVDLRTIIDELANNSNTAKDLILELARRFDETKRCEQSQICRKIKEILEDKIKAGKITEKWIEECLPPAYKRRYTKSEVSSLSKQAKRSTEEKKQKNKNIIAVDAQSGKSILTTVDGRNDSNFLTHDRIEHGQNKEDSNQNTGSEDYDKCQALRSEIYELRQALKSQTSIRTADQIFATEIEFTIPKIKYGNVKAAMESSRDSISVTFDKSGLFQHADPDTLREKSSNG